MANLPADQQIDPLLKLEQLLDTEVEDLRKQNRITSDGKVLAAPRIEKAPALAKPAIGGRPDSPEAAALLDQIVPDHVLERAKKLKEVSSSFTGKPDLAGGQTSSAPAANPADVNHDWKPKPKEDPVEYADKAAYLAHILGAPHFEKQYSFFGGALILTLRTMTEEQLNQCKRQAWADDVSEGTNGAPGSQEHLMTRLERFSKYKMTGELAELKTTNDLAKSFAPFETPSASGQGVWPIKAAWQDLQRTTSAAVMNAIMQANQKFTVLVGRLQREAENPDFWKADSDT
jgi:hypothetical protein